MIKLKDKVERCLRDFPETRNSDITLMIKIWEMYHGIISDTIPLKKLYDLPTQESIKRERAWFNSDNTGVRGAKDKSYKKKRQYLPTDPIILKRRGIIEIEKREEFISRKGVYTNPYMISEENKEENKQKQLL